MADIIVLDGDDEEASPLPSCSASSSQPEAKYAPSKAKQAEPLQKAGRLQAENNKRFTEVSVNTGVALSTFCGTYLSILHSLSSQFMEFCSTIIQEHPEVLTYLQTRHAKASPDFLSSVEFRNNLERCFTRAKNNGSKIYVFINELCTVLKQHSVKKKLTAIKVNSGSCNLTDAGQSTSATPVGDNTGMVDGGIADNEEPSTSSVQRAGVDVEKEKGEAEKKKRRASQKQVSAQLCWS